MRICMELWGSFPPDIRVKREARYLVDQGHRVTIVCDSDTNEPKKEIIDEIEIIRVPRLDEPKRSINDLMKSVTLVDWTRYRTLRGILASDKFDVLHVHDLPPLRTAMHAARGHETAVVADLHELYPQSLEGWREDESLLDRLRPHRLFRPSWRFKRLERRLLTSVDAVIAESEPAKRYYISEQGVDSERITVVRNVPDLERLHSFKIKKLDCDASFVIVYVGNFSGQRDLQTAIDALPIVHDTIPDAKLVLVGDGPDSTVNRLKMRVSEQNLEDFVEFTGWVDFECVPSYFAASDVSLCLLQQDNLDSQCAIANKLFQSMAFETPIVVTPTEAMAQLIERTEAGLVANSSKPEDVGKALVDIYSREENYREKGLSAVKSEYNIQTEGENILKAYNMARKY